MASFSGKGVGSDSTHQELVRSLSEDERSALLELGRGKHQGRAQSAHSFRLLQLGLAELSSGGLVLTKAGLTALAVVRDV